MMRLKPTQLIFALLTLVMFIVMTISSETTSHIPAQLDQILIAADTSSTRINSASQEILAYVAVTRQWIGGIAAKSAVEITQALLTKDLDTFNSLSGKSIGNLVNTSSLRALTTADAVIQKSPQGILPSRLQVPTGAALDPSLKIIANLPSDLSLSLQNEIDTQLKSVLSARQKYLAINQLILNAFLLMLSILILWVGFTFLARYKSIQSSIKTQLDDLESSKDELERTRVVVTELKILDNEKSEFNATLAKFAEILQDQRNLMTLSKTVLSELAPLMHVQHGVFYIMNKSATGGGKLQLLSSYAYNEQTNIPKEWKIGEGLVGQCAVEKKRILLTEVPDDYIQISSGLGGAKPLNIVVQPIIYESEVKAVLELASFEPFSPTQQALLVQLTEFVGIRINNIELNMRTHELLRQSQNLTEELQSQHEELRETNRELAEEAQLLADQKHEVEIINREMEHAKTLLEEKASQLETTSKYKSEFLSNMSHELRTPLNSLLILAEHLSENFKNRLDPEEVEYAKLIQACGTDLLSLINEILDFSKIESGTVLVKNVSFPFTEVRDQIEYTFRQIARDHNLNFEITFANDLPSDIVTDGKRLLQVMKNLISNAFKFTKNGKVWVRVDLANSGWNPENKNLNEASVVIIFAVEDSGIGIAENKQQVIFEAFQQGDSGTARNYGGTGLGLSISREIANLLGGELKLVRSAPQHGSTFALYLPQNRISDGMLRANLESG